MNKFMILKLLEIDHQILILVSNDTEVVSRTIISNNYHNIVYIEKKITSL